MLSQRGWGFARFCFLVMFVCVCVCVCVLQVHVSLLALSPSVHSPAAHNTALLHTKLHTNEHTAIKQMTWFKASDWYTCLFFFFFFFFFHAANKAYEELNPLCCIYHKAPTVSCCRINLPHRHHRLSLISKPPQNSSDTLLCCPNTTNHVKQLAYCSFPNITSPIVVDVSEFFFFFFFFFFLIRIFSYIYLVTV